MFEYFYNEILRRTIISFGTLFNDIKIKHVNDADSILDVIKVPLAYGPTQKFLSRLEQTPDLNKSTAMTLPRMSFEFTGMTYDPSRKVTTTQNFLVKDPNDEQEIKKSYMPVPYNMAFELSIMSKLNDDALQIVEQILPYFQPQYNLTVELVDMIKEKRDVPIILENITMQDDYEGDFTTRRVLLYTLRFTAKTYLFGPLQKATKDIIKKSSINYISGGRKSTNRSITYSATPRAIKNYTGNIVTNLSNDISTSDTFFEVDNVSGLTEKTYINIGQEELYIKSITGNKILVDRGADKTVVSSHLRGDPIKSITDEDSSQILIGDDFGFNGSNI